MRASRGVYEAAVLSICWGFEPGLAFSRAMRAAVNRPQNGINLAPPCPRSLSSLQSATLQPLCFCVSYFPHPLSAISPLSALAPELVGALLRHAFPILSKPRGTER